MSEKYIHVSDAGVACDARHNLQALREAIAELEGRGVSVEFIRPPTAYSGSQFSLEYDFLTAWRCGLRITKTEKL